MHDFLQRGGVGVQPELYNYFVSLPLSHLIPVLLLQWAYGVLLWEIMSMGVLPYPGIDNQHLMAYLESGQRLLKPDGCPDSV